MKKSVSIFLAMILSLMCVCSTLNVFAESENASITYTLERVRTEYEQYGIVKAFLDGVCIWTYTTNMATLTELETISDVYSYGDMAYIVVDGTLYALNASDGKEKWKISDVGASNSCVFDENGNIYISGFYGPNLKIISKNGDVLYKEENEDYYWIHDLKINENTLYVYYDSEIGGVKTFDISKFNVSKEKALLNAFIEQVVGYNSDYLYFLPDDYDNDGALEAFGITGWGLGEETHSNVDIWFINSNKECSLVASDLYGFLRDTIDTGKGKFIIWEKSAGGSVSSSYLFGCKGTLPHSPSISGEYENFRQENGRFYADKSDFSKGYHDWITEEFIFNSETAEFTINEETSFGSQVSDWAKEEVEEAYDENLVPEVLVGKDLTQKVDRAEFAAIAVALYENLTGGTAAKANNPFNDIYGNACEEDILKAYNLDITLGTSATTFDPNLNITREQMATMLTRAYKKSEFKDWTIEKDGDYPLNFMGVQKFADDNEISDYAKESVYFMARWDIIKGVGDNKFAPKNSATLGESYGYATREQAVIIALRSAKHL